MHFFIKPPGSGLGFCQFYAGDTVVVDSLFNVAAYIVYGVLLYFTVLSILSGFAIVLMRKMAC